MAVALAQGEEARKKRQVEWWKAGTRSPAEPAGRCCSQAGHEEMQRQPPGEIAAAAGKNRVDKGKGSSA
jgi:hypothetical protein